MNRQQNSSRLPGSNELREPYRSVKKALAFKSVDQTLVCVTIQMKAIEQYFHVVLFIMLYKVVLIFRSVDFILVCDHSNESY